MDSRFDYNTLGGATSIFLQQMVLKATIYNKLYDKQLTANNKIPVSSILQQIKIGNFFTASNTISNFLQK